VARAEAEAARLGRRAKAQQRQEPFERHLADAYAVLLSGSGKGRARRLELVVLVSHEVVKRGWTDVRDGEVCKILGVGPVSPEVAKEIAQDAFLSGVFPTARTCTTSRGGEEHPDRGRHRARIRRATRIRRGLLHCCRNRFKTEFDHVTPHVARGPSSKPNLKPRCWRCNRAKTRRDRNAGRLRPPEP
jgi:hypothetical protein